METGGSSGRRRWQTAIGALPLFAFWVALSGEPDLFHLALGLVTAMAVAAATRRLFQLPPRPIPPKDLLRAPLHLHRFVAYGAWLAVQIFRSALDVALLVLHPRLPVRPRMVRIEDRLPHRVARLTLAHSITLTPGTVTIGCDDEAMVVHAIDEPSAAALEANGGRMAEGVRRLFAALSRKR